MEITHESYGVCALTRKHSGNNYLFMELSENQPCITLKFSKAAAIAPLISGEIIKSSPVLEVTFEIEQFAKLITHGDNFLIPCTFTEKDGKSIPFDNSEKETIESQVGEALKNELQSSYEILEEVSKVIKSPSARKIPRDVKNIIDHYLHQVESGINSILSKKRELANILVKLIRSNKD